MRCLPCPVASVVLSRCTQVERLSQNSPHHSCQTPPAPLCSAPQVFSAALKLKVPSLAALAAELLQPAAAERKALLCPVPADSLVGQLHMKLIDVVSKPHDKPHVLLYHMVLSRVKTLNICTECIVKPAELCLAANLSGQSKRPVAQRPGAAALRRRPEPFETHGRATWSPPSPLRSVRRATTPCPGHPARPCPQVRDAWGFPTTCSPTSWQPIMLGYYQEAQQAQQAQREGRPRPPLPEGGRTPPAAAGAELLLGGGSGGAAQQAQRDEKEQEEEDGAEEEAGGSGSAAAAGEGWASGSRPLRRTASAIP